MKKEKQPEKRAVIKKSPKILKNKVSPLIKRGRPNLITKKSPVPSKRKLNQCQKMRLSRNKHESFVNAHYFENFTVTNLMLYDRISEDFPNKEVNEVIIMENVTAGQLIQFLEVEYWHFLVLLHLMIEPNTLCIQDALDPKFKEKHLTQQVERGFLFGLCALRRNQNELLEQQWLSFSMRQIISVFIISVMLQGVGQIKNFQVQFQIDYHSKFADLQDLTESIFYEVVTHILSLSKNKLQNEKVSKKLFTRKVFDYLIAKNQEISKIVRQQIFKFQKERNPEMIHQCVYPLLTMENFLGLNFVKIKGENFEAYELIFNQREQLNINNQRRTDSFENEFCLQNEGESQNNEVIQRQSSPYEDYFDFFQETCQIRYLPPLRSYDQNKYMEAIKIYNEGVVRHISKRKAKELYSYERTQEQKRDRRQETRRNTLLKNQNQNKLILNELLAMLEIKQQTVQDLTSSQIEQKRYLNAFLSQPEIDTYLIDKNKVNPQIVKKMKFPGVAYHEIKHQNREIDELISQLIQDENCIAESVANLIYHGMVAYKIHLRPQQ